LSFLPLSVETVADKQYATPLPKMIIGCLLACCIFCLNGSLYDNGQLAVRS